jgi:hypothetical protein
MATCLSLKEFLFHVSEHNVLAARMTQKYSKICTDIISVMLNGIEPRTYSSNCTLLLVTCILKSNRKELPTICTIKI